MPTGVIEKYTNVFGEEFKHPETVVYCMKNFLGKSIDVELTGIDAVDCLEIFERRRKEFRREKGNVAAYTPRLTSYYDEKKGQEQALP